MAYESHLSTGLVFRRGAIDKSCANCIYSICQLALHSGGPGPVQRGGAVFAVPLTFVILSWALLFGSSENQPQLHHFLPEEEGNWKEGDSEKSHTWEAGVCETLKRMQSAA